MATVTSESQHMHNGRLVLVSWYYSQGVEHYYADRVPCQIKWYSILNVLACIFTTPIALLCCLPTVRYLEKTQDKLESGDFPGAQAAFRRSLCCRILGWLWFSLFISLVLSGIIVGIALAVGLSKDDDRLN